ncbi:MAG TPA: class I SAM-dependent methyltransferase [Candidatus Eisenbacteria bacterium]|nr:class I SAM-dependent methyltransferase [Candidatus Eisenbacteria bacterium]
MKAGLLGLLACPACGGGLVSSEPPDARGEIPAGTLSCPAGHRYAVAGSVPHFSAEKEYVRAFDFIHKSPVCRLSEGPAALSCRTLAEREFTAQTGFDPERMKWKRVLDAGCGGGRFLVHLAERGVRAVGFDLQSFVLTDCASRHPDFELVQGDLFHPPFREGSFDYIYSLGVLHHTPDPKAAFLNLVRLLRPGGKIAVWVYPKKFTTPFSDFWRPLTVRMPAGPLYAAGWAVTGLYGPLLKVPGLNRVLKRVLFRMRLPWHDDWSWRRHSFMDWYGARYQFKYSPEELRAWFREAGLSDIRALDEETSMQGTKL